MMRHVKAVWFERVAHRVPSGKTLSWSHTLVVVTDLLTDSRELTIPVDLVVLVTGMVPRENKALVDVLKAPRAWLP